MSRGRYYGFSLVEVLIAIGVIAFALPAIIALLASSHTRASEAVDRQGAISAIASAEAFLEADNFAAASQRIAAPGGLVNSDARLYITRDFTQVGWANDVEPMMRYYAVTLERNEQIAVPGTLVVTLRVEWPAPALESESSRAVVHVLRGHSVLMR